MVTAGMYPVERKRTTVVQELEGGLDPVLPIHTAAPLTSAFTPYPLYDSFSFSLSSAKMPE